MITRRENSYLVPMFLMYSSSRKYLESYYIVENISRVSRVLDKIFRILFYFISKMIHETRLVSHDFTTIFVKFETGYILIKFRIG